MSRYLMVLSIVLFFFLLVPISASAAAYDGAHLLNGCRVVAGDEVSNLNKEEKENASYFCLGILMGISSLHHVQTIRHRLQTGLCLPEEITIDDLVKLTITYLEQNRYLLEDSAGVVASRAIYEKYACK